MLTLAIAVVAAWVCGAGGSVESAATVATFASVAGVVALLLERRVINGRWMLEPPTLFALVLVVWHFSFWPVYLLDAASTYRVHQYLTFAPQGTVPAMYICTAAVFATIAGVQMGLRGVRAPKIRAMTRVPPAVYWVAYLGVTLVAIYWVAKGRAQYGEYVGQTSVFEQDGLRRISNLGIVLVLGAIGPILLFEENRRRRWQFTAFAMAPTLAVSLFYGTRYVAFSAVVLALTAIGMRHRRSGAMRLALVAVLLVPVGAIVKEARAGNVNSVDDARTVLTVKEPNPFLEFPEEIGQGFTPVAGIIQSTTDPRSGAYRYGRTFAGASLTVVPSGPRLAGVEVDRPTFDLSAERLGDGYFQEGLTVGYSLIAELFLNFGAWGVVAGMALFGWALGAAYRASIIRDRPGVLFALWAVMGFALYATRNDAFTTLRYMVWGALIFWMAARWDRHRTARTV